MGLAAHANPFFYTLCLCVCVYTITQKVSVPMKQGRVPPGPISEHSAAQETDFPLSGSVGRSGRAA